MWDLIFLYLDVQRAIMAIHGSLEAGACPVTVILRDPYHPAVTPRASVGVFQESQEINVTVVSHDMRWKMEDVSVCVVLLNSICFVKKIIRLRKWITV